MKVIVWEKPDGTLRITTPGPAKPGETEEHRLERITKRTKEAVPDLADCRLAGIVDHTELPEDKPGAPGAMRKCWRIMVGATSASGNIKIERDMLAARVHLVEEAQERIVAMRKFGMPVTDDEAESIVAKVRAAAANLKDDGLEKFQHAAVKP